MRFQTSPQRQRCDVLGARAHWRNIGSQGEAIAAPLAGLEQGVRAHASRRPHACPSWVPNPSGVGGLIRGIYGAR
eukprot:5981826-Pyramimonas_sp.AAC.1